MWRAAVVRERWRIPDDHHPATPTRSLAGLLLLKAVTLSCVVSVSTVYKVLTCLLRRSFYFCKKISQNTWSLFNLPTMRCLFMIFQIFHHRQWAVMLHRCSFGWKLLWKLLLRAARGKHFLELTHLKAMGRKPESRTAGCFLKVFLVGIIFLYITVIEII